MTLDGFLTFLGLAAAAYAIIPPVARLRIRLQLGVQVTVACLALLLVLYFEFFQFVALPCPAVLNAVCGSIQISPHGPFTPQMAAFVVVLVWMILAFGVVTSLPPSRRSLRPMADLLEQLFHQARYSEAVDFIVPHLTFAERAQNRRLWSQRVRDWLAGDRILDVEDLLAKRDGPDGSLAKRNLFGPLASMLPSGHAAQENAERILNLMYLSRQFMDYVSSQRPSVTAVLLTLDVHQRFDFSNRLLESLISAPGSRLYEELERNANYEGIGHNLVVGHNFILHAYFSDVRVAGTLHAWKPVGDYVITSIRNPDEKNVSKLKEKSDDFDKGRWHDPVAVGIAYFDLMVRSAFSQDVEDAMWLAYLDHFVDELAQVYDTGGSGIDNTAEFPIWASRLIYEVVNTLGRWVELTHVAPVNSPHRTFPKSLHLGSPSIPANAARSLGISLHHILRSKRIEDTFAMYMVECAIRDLRYLVQPEDKEARRFLIKSIVSGGGHEKDKAYGARLAHLISRIDYVLIQDAEDLVGAAQLAFPDENFGHTT
ncbi:hypothetical protein [Rhizobium mayense]|uniref:Uncharacterized protein n=1 Tax=Rhizobium mayense TaxID=1312184 RepID=A0ABT7K536_9HYPH|nr:hypothetical protein [Rhizobium mayense]MDL2403726.1 hypothetical protein [Rhizobium mayense]